MFQWKMISIQWCLKVKNFGGPVVIGGDNQPSPVGIGLTDPPNIGGPVAPLAPPVPVSLILCNLNKKKIKKENLGEHRLHLYRQRLNIREILTWTHLLRISVVFQLKQLNVHISEVYLEEFQNWGPKHQSCEFHSSKV